MPRYVIEVMYDGTQFHGSQIQGDTPTVQLAINKAMSTLLRIPVATTGASRTDEGVHALGNYFHFDLEEDPKFDLPYRCNAVLPGGVAIKKLYRAVNPEFNARFEAETRRYRYRIYKTKNPFLQNRALFYPFAVSRDILDMTAQVIRESTQFESFSKRNAQSKTFICTIKESYWEEVGEELHYVVMANRFLRGMVRGLVATQLHIARENGTADDLRTILKAQDCTKAYFNVTGHGLYLEEIKYPDGLLQQLY